MGIFDGLFNGFLGNTISAIGQGIGNSNSFKNWQKTYNIQRRDALADRAYQENLLRHSAEIDKHSKQMAGINPVLGMGNGNIPLASVPISQSNGTSLPNSNPLASFSDFGNQFLQASLLDSQKENLDSASAKNRADASKTATDTQQAKEALDVYRKTKTSLIAQADAALQQMLADKQLKQEQVENIRRGYKVLDANTDNIMAQTERLKQLTPLEQSELLQKINNLKAATNKTQLESAAVGYENVLRRLGIVPGNDIWSNLLGSAMMGKTGEVVSQFLTQMVNGFTSGLTTIFDTVRQGYEYSKPVLSSEGFDQHVYNLHKPRHLMRFERTRQGNIKPVVYWQRYNYKTGTYGPLERAKNQKFLYFRPLGFSYRKMVLRHGGPTFNEIEKKVRKTGKTETFIILD